MIQSVFIISSDTGEVMFEKHWMGKPVSRGVCDWFWAELQRAGSYKELASVLVSPTYYLLHIERSSVIFLACTQMEMPPLFGVEFLNRVADMVVEYLGNLNEDTLKDNFITVYQLLDEMMDGGFPLITEPNPLRDLVAPPDLVSRVVTAVTGAVSSSVSRSSAAAAPMPPIPWRSQGIRHVANEIFVELAEEMDATLSRDGQLLRCQVHGNILVNSRLSGTPDLAISFTNPGILHDVQFHPCVRVHAWENSRSLSFVPPDGNFKLASYRVKNVRSTPLYVKPQISFAAGGTGHISVMVGVRDEQQRVDSISVSMALPDTLLSSQLSVNHGQISVDHTRKVCMWTIGKVPMEKAPCLTGTISLEAREGGLQGMAPLMVKFKVAGVALSGLAIDSIHLQNESYNPYKGCKAHTSAGSFEVRC